MVEPVKVTTREAKVLRLLEGFEDQLAYPGNLVWRYYRWPSKAWWDCLSRMVILLDALELKGLVAKQKTRRSGTGLNDIQYKRTERSWA